MNSSVGSVENLLELMFENNHMPVALMDREFNFLRVNRAYAAADDKKPDYFTGKNHFDLYPNEDNRRIFSEVVRTGESYYAKARSFEYGNNPERGITHWDWTLAPVREDKEIIGVMLQLVDVTQHIEAEHRLARAQRLSHTASWEWDLDTNQVKWSDAMYHLLGIEGKESHRSISLTLDHIHPDDRHKVEMFYQAACDDKADPELDLVHRYLRHPGEIRFAHQYIEVFRDKNGSPRRILGTFHDITETMQAQEKLEQEKSFRKAVIDTANAIVVVLDKQGRIVQFNNSAEEKTFYRADEVLGKYVWDIFLLPEEVEPVRAVFDNLKNSTLPDQYTNYWLAKDKSYILIEWNNAVLTDANGVCEYIVSIGIDITEKREIERRHHITSLAVEKATSAIAMAGLDGKLNYINQAFLDNWGYTNKSDVLGRPAIDFWKHPEKAQEVVEVLLTEGSWDGELVALRADGTEMNMHLASSTTYDKDGQPVNMMGSFIDVTKQKEAEAELRYKQDILNKAQSIARIGTWDWDLEKRTLTWTDEIFDIFGVNKAEFGATYAHFLDSVHPDDRDMVDDAVQASLANSEVPYRLEHRVVKPDGEVRYVEEVGHIYRDDSGKPIRMIGVVQDISERVHAETELRETSQLLDNIIENVPNMIFVKHASDLRFKYLNRAGEKLLGRDRNELIGHNDYDFFPKEQADFFTTNDREVLELHDKVDIQEEMIETLHGPRILHTQKIALRDQTGYAQYLLGISEDITEKVQSERKLRSQARIIDQIHDSVIATDLDGFVTGWNKGAERIFGYTSDDMLGKHISVVYPEDQLYILQNEVIAPLKKEGVHNIETRLRRKSGEEFYALLSLAMLYDENGVANGMIGYTMDISERKRVEMELQKNQARLLAAQRIASIGNWELKIDTGELYWSDEIYNIFEIDRNRFGASYEAFLEAIHPDDRDMVNHAYTLSLEKKEPYEIAHRLLMKDGRIKYVMEQCESIFDENGKALYSMGTIQDITELKQASHKLESQAMIIDQIHDSVISTDLDGNIQTWNRGAERLFGYSAEEAIGKHITLIYPQEEIRTLYNQIIEPLKANGVHETESIMRRKSGENFIAHLSLSMLKDHYGTEIGMIGYSMDITQQRESEAKLQRKNRIFKNLVNFKQDIAKLDVNEIIHISLENIIRDTDLPHASIAFHDQDKNGFVVIDTVNSKNVKFEKGMFINAADTILSEILLLRFPKYRLDISQTDKLYKIDRQLLEYGIRSDFLVPLVSENKFLGTINVASEKVDGISEDARQYVTLIAPYLAQAISNAHLYESLREKEARLEESEESFRQTFEHAAVGVAQVAPDGTWLKVNKMLCDITGYPEEELLTRTFQDITHPEDLDKDMEYVRQLLAGEIQTYSMEKRYIRRDGGISWINLSVALVRNADGTPRHFVSIIKDINIRKRIEFELERQRRILIDLTDNLPGMIYQCRNDKNWTLDFANKGVTELTGYDQADLLSGRVTYGDLIHPDDSQHVWDEVQRALENRSPFTVRYRIIDRENQEHWVWERGAGFYDADGELEFLHGFITDITEQKLAEDELERYRNHLEELVDIRTRELKQTQDELVKKERLATLGQLTATVSHELRNPLGAIHPSLFMVKKLTKGGDDKLNKAIERVERNIGRCDRIVDELLDFTRVEGIDRADVELATWITEILQEQKKPRKISIVKEFGENCLKASIDKEQMQRAMVNVFNNAVQAIEQSGNSNKGEILIRTSQEGDNIVISITDNGVGIKSGEIEKVFEPLYSTKSFGVGLGMVVVRKILESHGGSVEVESTEGKGTTVFLKIPVKQDSEVAA